MDFCFHLYCIFKFSYKEGRKAEYKPEDKKLEFPNTDVKFKLSKADFDQTIKAASVLGLPHVCFAGNGQAIQIVATDVNNSSSDEFKSEVGTTSKNFNMVYKIENLKLFSGDYDVALTARITKFSHSSTNLQYYIASESDSTFDIEGIDSAHKLVILGMLAYGAKPDLNKVYIEGISSVSSEDIKYANTILISITKPLL